MTSNNNHGANRVQVASFHQVSFPATTAGPIPRPFEYRVPLPAPYQYNGQGGLCWEVRLIARQGSGVVYHNGVSGSTTNPAAATLSLGAGCKAGGRTTAVQLTASSQMNWPQASGLFSYSGHYAPATTPSNPLGVVTSNGVEHNWVPPYASLPVGRVHLASSTGPTGTANNRYGLVVRFE